MRWFNSFIIIVVAVLLSSCKPRQTTITGQVFIAAGAGLSIRLGAVEILLIERHEATNYLQKIETEIINKAKSESDAALQSRQQNIKTAQSEVSKARDNLADEQQKFTLAQASFSEAKAKYDEIMASAPFLTNTVYMRIKRDLDLRTKAIPGEEQAIKTDEDGLANSAYPPKTVWISEGNASHLETGNETARVALHASYQSYLVAARQDLENNNAQIKADNEALQKIEATFSNFQSTKLNEERAELDRETARFNASKSTLDYKESYAKSLEGQNPIPPHIPDRQDCLSKFSPPSISKVNTDADGNFSIICPIRGMFCIFATTQSTADGEKYYWLIDAPNQTIPVRVLLNNNNLVEIDPDGYFKNPF
jgi:hypothetical protein